MNQTHIKDFIIESGMISAEDIKKAENFMFENNTDFLEAMLKTGLLDQETLSEISANIMGIPKVNLEDKIITLDIFKIIPEPVAKSHNIVCFQKEKDSISVAFCYIKDLEVLEKFLPQNKELKLFLADKKAIAEKNKKYTDLISEELSFKNRKNVERILKVDTFGIRTEADLPENFKNDIANDLYTEKFINGIIDYALNSKADFVFFNLLENSVIISFRIFDRNYQIMEIDKSVLFSISTKLKYLADINIFEPFIVKQASFFYGENTIFTTFVQTDFGEAITLQIDGDKKFKVDISSLSEKQANLLLPAHRKDSGFFVLSGGKLSGKSTTLYSFLEFDVEKDKDIYSLETAVYHQLEQTKQISITEKTNILPLLVKIFKNHPDVVAIEKVTKGIFPMVFNYVSTSKKVFLSHTMEAGKFADLLLEMDFDKGQIVKNFSLFIQHQVFKELEGDRAKEYFLNKDEQNLVKSFLYKSDLEQLFAGVGLEKEAKKPLSKISFYTKGKKGEKTNTRRSFFAPTIPEKILDFPKKKSSISDKVYVKGILDLGLFLENSFLKRYSKEKIKNSLRREIKKAVLENALLASHRRQIDIKEVLKYLTK